MLEILRVLGFILADFVILLALAAVVYLIVCLIDASLEKWRSSIRWTLKELRKKV